MLIAPYITVVNRLLPLALIALASVARGDVVEDFVRAEMARFKSPSIAVGIVRDGRLVRSEIFGKANLELDVDAKKGDLYEIGSITKQFTAFATMMLVEEGKLSLEDSVTKHLDDAPKAWAPIRIKHLLYQMSGLQDYALMPGLGLVEDFERAKFMTEMGALALDFEPGVAWAYSNTNYALLGWVIAKASGKNYQEFMLERVFKPLQMERTTFSDPHAIIPRRAGGYLSHQGQVLRSKFSAASINSDGTILSNIEDMAKWDVALRERKLLKPSSYEALWSPATLNSGRVRFYGMGWNLNLPNQMPYVGHGGNSAGYSAGYVHYPTAKLSVIVLGNIYAFGGENLAKAIAELVEPSLKPTTPKELPDPNLKRTERLRQALAALAAGKPDESLMEPEVVAPMKTKRAAMSQGMAPLRQVDRLSFVGEEKLGKDHLVTYRVVTPARDFVATLVWSENDKLAMFSMRADGPPKKTS